MSCRTTGVRIMDFRDKLLVDNATKTDLADDQLLDVMRD